MPPKEDTIPPPPPPAGTGADTGTRAKDTKAGNTQGATGGAAGNTGKQKEKLPQFNAPPPQLLQLTPELFQPVSYTHLTLPTILLV